MYAFSQLVSSTQWSSAPSSKRSIFALRLNCFLNWLMYVRASCFFFFKCITFRFYLRLSFIQNSFVLSLITPLHNSWIIPTLTPVYSDVSDLYIASCARLWRSTAHLFQWKPKGSQQRKEEIIMISRIRSGKLWSFKKWRTWKYFKWITRHLFSGIWRRMQIWGNVTPGMLHTSAITPSSIRIIPDQ